MNLGTLKDRLNKRYLAGVAAALAVAAIACLWLLPSTYEQQLGEARRLLETGKQAFNANDTYTALPSLQKVFYDSTSQKMM